MCLISKDQVLVPAGWLKRLDCVLGRKLAWDKTIAQQTGVKTRYIPGCLNFNMRQDLYPYLSSILGGHPARFGVQGIVGAVSGNEEDKIGGMQIRLHT